MWMHSRCLSSLLFIQTVFVLFLWVFLTDAKLPKPRLFGKSIARRDLDTRYANTKKKIVLIHNFYRTRVSPPARDMLQMSWHKGAQETAQKWAGACQMLIHDKPNRRWVDDYGSCGQNIFISNVEVDWMFVAKAWYLEHENFTYGSAANKLSDVGHYTQMVWYNSHKIGCGFKFCGPNLVDRPFFNYVCNYCPIGNNLNRLGRPYATGKPCDKCRDHCKYKKLCTNSCPYADQWVNCADLNKTWHSWLCRNPDSVNHGCQATCKCPDSIR